MMKLNNKAMTTIEILLAFTLVSIVATSMLNVILSYKTREEIESVNSVVVKYKNTITRAVQNDVTMKHLEAATVTTDTTSNANYEITTIAMTFTNEITPGVKTKNFVIYKSKSVNQVSDYITYPDSNNVSVRYSLEDLGGASKTGGFKIEEIKHLRFGSITAYSRLDTLVIDIPIYHHEIGSKHHISIKVPINQ